MKKLVALVLGCVLLGCASERVVNSAPPGDFLEASLRAQGYSAIELSKASTGLHVLSAEINGRPAIFIVDSGASATVVDSNALEHFSLAAAKSTQIPSFGAAGFGTPVGVTTADSFLIGDVAFRRRQMLVVDLGNLTKVMSSMTGQQVHGIIGQDILEGNDAIIDFRQRRLYLKAR